MIDKYFDGIIPATYKNTEFDENLRSVAVKSIANTKLEFDKFELQNGMLATWELINRANKYVDETAPWTLAKDPEKKDELASVMYHLAESIRVTAHLVAPYLVETAPKILNALGLDEELSIETLEFGKNLGGIKVNKCEPLFKRLDIPAELKYFEEKIASQQATKEVKKEEMKKEDAKKELISIDDFAKVELKVGEILESKQHENADKLLVSKIKIGDEIRQIVSGIAKYYNPKDLIGRKVVVVTNLKPVKIRGVESNGMVLCAADGEKLEIVEIKEATSGSTVR
jgi:methionyl-tRNA synthetase